MSKLSTTQLNALDLTERIDAIGAPRVLEAFNEALASIDSPSRYTYRKLATLAGPKAKGNVKAILLKTIEKLEAAIVAPGKAGTFARSRCSTLRMGNSEGKPTRVIDGDRVMCYVGIGWIDERPARPEDADRYPVLI